MTRRAVALYLQDAHPIREGMELRAVRRGARASRRCGRPRAGSCARRRCRWRRSPRSTERIKVGSGVVDIWTRNPARLAATFSTLDDLAPGPGDPRHRRVVGPAGARRSASTAASRCTAMREIVDGGARAARQRDASRSTASSCTSTASSSTTCTRSAGPKDVPIYIGATGMQMMELTGEIADGVVLNYLVSPGVQRARRSTRLADGAAQGRAHARRHRPAAARRVLARRRPRRRARHAPACSSRSTSASSRTS